VPGSQTIPELWTEREAEALRFAVVAAISFIAIAFSALAMPNPARPMPLGVEPAAASGRRVYDARCGDCHYASAKRNLRGPSLNGLFKKRLCKTECLPMTSA